MDLSIHFQWRSVQWPFEHFLPSSIFPAVEVLCKLLAYFLIQSFRIVLSWILLYRIWNYRLYIWRITKSFHQNNTVEANTLTSYDFKKFYKEYCYIFKDHFNTDDDEEATFLTPPVFPSRLTVCSPLWSRAVQRR